MDGQERDGKQNVQLQFVETQESGGKIDLFNFFPEESIFSF